MKRIASEAHSERIQYIRIEAQNHNRPSWQIENQRVLSARRVVLVSHLKSSRAVAPREHLTLVTIRRPSPLTECVFAQRSIRELALSD